MVLKLHSKSKAERKFPDSVQSRLFVYLNKQQQNCVSNLFRSLKKSRQMQLSLSLLDYLEQGETHLPDDKFARKIFNYLTDDHGEIQRDFGEKAVIRPLYLTPPSYIW